MTRIAILALLGAAATPASAADAPIRIWGPAAMRGIAEHWADAYRQAHPEARFELTMRGSDTAIPGLYGGQADIALMGRRNDLVDDAGFSRPLGYNVTRIEIANGSHTITARATNTFGIMTVVKIAVTVSNGASSQPPTISIAQPATNATVSGAASIQGTAADAAALASVKVSIDSGTPVAATGLQNWTYALDTTKLSNGVHTVTATAVNQAGLTAAATITLNVSNASTQPPTISIAQPANNAIVSGAASIQGTAADAAALTSVKVSIDSATPVAATDLQNWTYALDTTTGKLLARIKVGAGAHGLCVWPQPGRYSLGHTGILR